MQNKIVLTEKLKALSVYRAEALDELTSILDYWINYTIDQEHGGFYGSVSNDNIPHKTAPKGAVLNSRILWAFSSTFLFTGEQRYFIAAKRAYQYIIEHFIDHELGGIYWSVDHKGNMLDGKSRYTAFHFAYTDCRNIIKHQAMKPLFILRLTFLNVLSNTVMIKRMAVI